MNIHLNTVSFFHHAHRNLHAIVAHAAALLLAAHLCGCAPSQVRPKIIAELPGYSEGIVFDTFGAAFISTVQRESVFIMRGSKPPTLWYNTIEPNGHEVLPDGTHLLAARGGVQHIDSNGNLIRVLTPEIATPNDLALDGDGGVYITAPAVSESDRVTMRSGVYYLDAARTLRKVADDFCYPNGVVVRADGKSLLVSDSCHRRIYEFQILSPGVLTNRKLLIEIADPKSIPDGMTLDQAGRLYMADYGSGLVLVINMSGQVLHTYPTGLQHASNVAFGGSRGTDLYITGSQGKQAGPGRLVVLPLGISGRSNLTLPASLRKP